MYIIAIIIILLDDDDIETVIQVRCVDVAPSGIPPTTTSPIRQSLGGTPDVEVDMEPHQVEQQHQQQSVDEDDTVSHGTSASGEPASCRQFNSTGLVDCAACLGTQTTEILNRMNAPQRQVAKLVLACLRDAGQGGITKRALLVSTTSFVSCHQYQHFILIIEG